jgi:hypothetical protein
MTLGITSAAAVLAEPGKPYDYRPEEYRYLQDLLRPYGRTVDNSRLESGTNVSHAGLFAKLIAGRAGEAARPDLVIVAYALPDLQPFYSLSSNVMSELGGTGRNMAISEQGVAAAFTAVQVAAAYDRTRQADRTVILVLEQATLPTPDELVDRIKPADAGALLVLSHGAVPRVAGIAHVERAGVAASISRWLLGQTLVVCGAHLDVEAPGVEVHRVRFPTYSVGPWFELARHWQSWTREFDRIVLAEADPRYPGRAHLAVFDTGQAP